MSSKNWCYDILGDVSRTFEIPISNLNSPISDYMCVGYLLCRIPDTVEDSPEIPTERKKELLNLYEGVIQGTVEPKVFESESMDSKPKDTLDPDHWRLVDNTGKVMRVFSEFPQSAQDIILEYVLEMVVGMRKFVTEHYSSIRIQDMDEFKEYCYYVAGTVGHMIASIDFDNPSDEIHNMAENYGLLLQSVNIAKDVHGDYYEEDSIYLPSDMLSDYGVEQDSLLKEENIDDTNRVLKDIIEYAEGLKDEARRYIRRTYEEKGTNHMHSWAIPYFLSVATLRELNENSEEALREGGVKISREEVGKILMEGRNIETEDLNDFEKRIKQGELAP
jgi:farnesyl-diphosphate farnesyltransferase